MATAAFDPDRIQAFTKEPEDFDEFWKKAIAEARKTDLDPKIILLPRITVRIIMPATAYWALWRPSRLQSPHLVKRRLLTGHLLCKALGSGLMTTMVWHSWNQIAPKRLFNQSRLICPQIMIHYSQLNLPHSVMLNRFTVKIVWERVVIWPPFFVMVKWD